MPIPTWVPGQVLAAADVNSWFVPLVAVKTSTQSVTSSTTAVNDTQLVVPVAANAVYIIRFSLSYDGSTTSGLAVSWAFPAGATYVKGTLAIQHPGVDFHTLSYFSGAQSIGALGAGSTSPAWSDGTLTTVGTSGNAQLMWCQIVSGATATRIFAGSYIALVRVG